MPTLAEALDLALEHHQAGRLAQAERIYRQILQAAPQQPDALHLLGVIFHQAGRHEEAARYIGQAISINPDQFTYQNNLGMVYLALRQFELAEACFRRAVAMEPEAAEGHNNLGNALKESQRHDEAMACYRRALELRPEFPEAENNLGLGLADEGDLEAAVACFERVLKTNPDHALAYQNLGNVLSRRGELDAAAAALREAIRRQPGMFEAHFNLGNVLRLQGKLDDAMASYRRALEIRPDSCPAYTSFGALLQETGRPEEAIACFHEAIRLDPLYADAYNNLGNALCDLDRTEEAVASYRRAIELRPDSAQSHYNLGGALRYLNRLEEALACYDRALELKPDYADAHANRGNVLKAQGRLDEAVACYRQAIDADPELVYPYSNVLFCRHFQPDATLAELAELHAQWDRRHAAPLAAAWQPHANSRDPQRVLRLGFISSDLRRHPIGYFLVRVLEALRAHPCELYCYADQFEEDDLTLRIRRAAHQWRKVRRRKDGPLAEQIRADGIDILFDLAGHTAGSRLLVFARKPAPIQITWIGYEGTTGLAAMDYLLADAHQVRGSEEIHCRERVLRMPDRYVCFDPPDDAPNVGPLPASARGRITYGSFSNPAKITPQVVAAWSEVLRRVEGSRLVLKYNGLDDPATCRRWQEIFAAAGIAPERLDIRGSSPYLDMLAEYNDLDLVLDPFPFSGSVTTLESLWMGVPVVTFPGQTFASRHSSGHLACIGLPETIARDREHYVQLAVELAGDLDHLAALRAGLRQRLAQSPLCDGPRFAAALMQLLRDAWREWSAAGCASTQRPV